MPAHAHGAWGEFSFSKEGRERLAVVLRALLIAQLVISLCIVIFCYNASVRVMTLLKDIHKVTVFLLYGLIICHVYCMKLQYTAGLRLVTWLLKFPHWTRASALCSLWIVCGTLVAVNGLLVYEACNGTLKVLVKELSYSLRIGIAQYLTEPTWKRLLDTMQVELSCCGVERPSDWHEIPWISVDFLNEESDLVMKLAGADGKILPPVTPYSCCTPRVLAACYHDPLQQAEWRQVWLQGSPLISASLHARGCVEAIRKPLTKALLALKYFNLLVFILQMFIMTLGQLLRTSARDAALSGDAEGIGRGCLLGRPRRERVAQRRSAELSEYSRVQNASQSGAGTLMAQRRRRGRGHTYTCLS